jgi:hypothetical protein
MRGVGSFRLCELLSTPCDPGLGPPRENTSFARMQHIARYRLSADSVDPP